MKGRRLSFVAVGLALATLIVASGAAVTATASGAAGSPLAYLALDPVRRWDIDVMYRLHRHDRKETSISLGYEWEGKEQVQELAVSVRGRLGARSVGLITVPLHHRRLSGRGRRIGPGGWEPLVRNEDQLVLQPITIGWRRESDWFSRDDFEWGVDVVLGSRGGWALVPQGRWVWLRDPVILGVELGMPWRFSLTRSPEPGNGRVRLTLDHAVNNRLVLSGGWAWDGRGPAYLWGWSVQVRPDRYWSFQVEWPLRPGEFVLLSGWRFRL